MKQHIIATILLLAVLTGTVGAADHNVNEGDSIQAAINSASDGDTIHVWNGTYAENIIVNKTLTLQGEGRDVVTVQAASTVEHVFNVTADYVNLSGFGVAGATGNKKAGIYLDDGVDHCNILCNNVSGSNRGIYMGYSDNNTLTNNTASNNSKYGIYLYNSDNNTLTNNTLTNNGIGIVMEFSSNNNLTSNTANSNSENGISLCFSNNNTLTSNTASNNSISGILVGMLSSNNDLTSNTASNNSHCGIQLAYLSYYNNLTSNTANSNGEYGIRLDSTSNNNVTNNTANSNGCGIRLLWSNYHNLTSNTANSNSEYGIYLDRLNNYNNLTSNTANSNGDYGIYLDDSSNYNNLMSNTASNNSNCGIRLYNSSNNLIYNNYFNNTNNTWDNGNNVWNTTKTTGPNIIGGPYIGGNYWRNYAGSDSDGDGFGDTPYNIWGSNKDNLPLVPWCGNLDGNMTVDAADLQLLLAHIFAGTPITRECAGDVDGSGDINILDARLLMNHLASPAEYPLNCSC